MIASINQINQEYECFIQHRIPVWPTGAHMVKQDEDGTSHLCNGPTDEEHWHQHNNFNQRLLGRLMLGSLSYVQKKPLTTTASKYKLAYSMFKRMSASETVPTAGMKSQTPLDSVPKRLQATLPGPS